MGHIFLFIFSFVILLLLMMLKAGHLKSYNAETLEIRFPPLPSYLFILHVMIAACLEMFLI